ncbi:DUF551 domain-containing protein, partial [Escherichia coli]|nr:DUF551 domain-containing protein [Escherichia coli]
MTTITKERLLTIKQWRETYGPGSNVVLPAEEAEELARIAVVSLEAKPIGAFHIAEQKVDGTSDYLKDGEWPIDNGIIEVYAAPPVPVVPEEKPMPNPLSMYAVDAVAAIAEVRGWNACRAAMLQAGNFRENKDSSTNNFRETSETSTNSPVIPDGWISCSERIPAQDDWVLIYSKHGEYMAGQVQGEYVELSDGTLSWLGNALYWML